MDEQIQNPRDDKANEPQQQLCPVTHKTLEQFDRISEEIMKRRDGKFFEDSTEIIRQMREERTEELMRRSRQYDEEESTPIDQSATDEVNQTHRRGRPITREAVERLRQVREAIMKERNGKPFEDSVEMLRREREKRTEYLMWVATGQHGKDPYEEDNEEDTPEEQL